MPKTYARKTYLEHEINQVKLSLRISSLVTPIKTIFQSSIESSCTEAEALETWHSHQFYGHLLDSKGVQKHTGCY